MQQTIEIIDKKIYEGVGYIIYRSPDTGCYCGYVRLPDDHQWIKHLKKIHYTTLFHVGKRFTIRDYDSIPVECHGGLTFGKHITKKNTKFGLGWWIGWDYAHTGDFMTMVRSDGTVYIPEPDGKIWDYSEVEAECKLVIDQVLKNYV